MNQSTVKTTSYNFTNKDLLDRLEVIKDNSNKVIAKEISGVEYLAFLEKQIKELEFINRVNEAKKLNIPEVEFYG